METDKLHPHYGHGVCGDRFWPRSELALMLRRLHVGNSVAVFGPRRNGKSSLLKECARLLREDHRHTVMEIDGQGMDAVASLFNRIVESLPGNNFDGFKARIVNLNLPKRFGEIVELWRGKSRESRDDAELVKRHWAALAQVLVQIIPTMNPRPVLMIDEITYLCENLQKQEEGSSAEVTRLLSMLREWREAGMTMVMAGSIGIRQYLRTIGVSLNLLNGIISIPLQVMSKENAKEMLEALACHQGIDWWDEHVSRAVLENSADFTHAAMQFAFDHVVPATKRAAIAAGRRSTPCFEMSFGPSSTTNSTSSSING